jgi:SAM-dependent methyltransferase
VADIGGGPGTHATHLAGRGYDVVLVDPVQAHVAQAAQAAQLASGAVFACQLGDARELDLPDQSFDAVLLLGPLYHLAEAEDRQQALREALRVLRPGGRLIAEVITRHAWILDATAKGLLADEGIWNSFEVNLNTGLSNDPGRHLDGVFWAYFHRVEELGPELQAAGFQVERLIGVEGFAWLLGNLGDLLAEPEQLLRVLALTEAEQSMAGTSAHVIAVASRPQHDR